MHSSAYQSSTSQRIRRLENGNMFEKISLIQINNRGCSLNSCIQSLTLTTKDCSDNRELWVIVFTDNVISSRYNNSWWSSISRTTIDQDDIDDLTSIHQNLCSSTTTFSISRNEVQYWWTVIVVCSRIDENIIIEEICEFSSIPIQGDNLTSINICSDRQTFSQNITVIITSSNFSKEVSRCLSTLTIISCFSKNWGTQDVAVRQFTINLNLISSTKTWMLFQDFSTIVITIKCIISRQERNIVRFNSVQNTFASSICCICNRIVCESNCQWVAISSIKCDIRSSDKVNILRLQYNSKLVTRTRLKIDDFAPNSIALSNSGLVRCIQDIPRRQCVIGSCTIKSHSCSVIEDICFVIEEVKGRLIILAIQTKNIYSCTCVGSICLFCILQWLHESNRSTIDLIRQILSLQDTIDINIDI